ncbi:hypothetical protein AQJ64_16020 [Streptomyces griseoruber]|uniref:Transposase n=1 Tax=Streptomyces griseoruber TaxID=1943 RepID=A0A101T203_9ACTN|nr:hypothetical protein AQJ64_16020 [Streptomyces griseoruber]
MHRILVRHERDRPGELLHVDVKKLGRIPDGGGHKVLGRLACSEIHGDEKAATCAAFPRRAAAFCTTCGIDRIERVLTDNACPTASPSPGR